jgi:hypothetical protein
MIGPMQRLSDDHLEIDALILRAIDALERQSAGDALAAVDLFWARLAVHVRAEHLRLFPALHDAAPDIAPLIAELRDDHDFFMTELAACIRSLRLAVEAPVTDSGLFQNVLTRLAVVSERLAVHNATEETDIYPLAEERLAPETVADLSTAIGSELERLPPRFS